MSEKDQPFNFSESIHQLEQGAQLIIDHLPPFLWSFFTRLKDEGFTESQALTVTIEYLKGSPWCRPS